MDLPFYWHFSLQITCQKKKKKHICVVFWVIPPTPPPRRFTSLHLPFSSENAQRKSCTESYTFPWTFPLDIPLLFFPSGLGCAGTPWLAPPLREGFWTLSLCLAARPVSPEGARLRDFIVQRVGALHNWTSNVPSEYKECWVYSVSAIYGLYKNAVIRS